jgi:hypothetical protein
MVYNTYRYIKRYIKKIMNTIIKIVKLQDDKKLEVETKSQIGAT